MNLIKIKDDVVLSVTPVTDGEQWIVVDTSPRQGAVLQGNVFVSPKSAALVDDATNEVTQVRVGGWADEQPTLSGSTWYDAPEGTIPSMVRKPDGSFVNPPPPRDVSAEIEAHKLALKVGLVNATKTDGGPDYPVSVEALREIREEYTDYINDISARVVIGEAVSDEEKATVTLIRSGFTAFKAIDAAGDVIRAAGDAADPIATDTRWPTLS